MRTLTRSSVLAIACVALLTGCSSKDKSTNPPGGGGGGGSAGVTQFGTQISGIYAQYFAANAAGYASAGVLLPYIAASLGSPAPPAAARPFSPAITCFDGVAGTTYEFDGAMYVAGSATGAPTNGVRYVLYGLDSMNQPNLADSIGFIEVRCTLNNPTSKSVGVTLVANGTTAFTVNGGANENAGVGGFNASGWLAATGAPQLGVLVFCDFSSEHIQYYSDYTTSDMQVQIGTVDSLTAGKRTLGASALKFSDPFWNVLLRIHGDIATETVTGGAVYYGDINNGTVQERVACVSGGTIPQPTYSAPDAGCDDLEFDVGPAMSSADLAIVAASYQQLLALHNLLIELAIKAFGVPSGDAS